MEGGVNSALTLMSDWGHLRKRKFVDAKQSKLNPWEAPSSLADDLIKYQRPFSVHLTAVALAMQCDDGRVW